MLNEYSRVWLTGIPDETLNLGINYPECLGIRNPEFMMLYYQEFIGLG